MARTEFPKAAAYDAYLHGRYLVQVRANPNFQTALRYFHAATDADPNFALGYAGMAEAYGALAAYGGMEPAEGFRLKEAAQNRALELDPNLAYAIVSKAYSLEMYHHDLAGAEREMRRAVELNWPEARHHHARILEDAGRLDEALAESRRSEELDPLWSVNSGTTDFILYKARRFDESLEHCRRTQRCGHYWLGLMHAAAGRKAEAVTELKQVKTTVPRALCLAALAWATIGEEARARAVLADTLREQKQQGNSTLNWCSPYEVASVHAELGDRAESLRWLAAADAQLDSRLFFVLSDAAWDRYRSDPEFVALLKRIQTPR
jgi:tetratricopeptide (TPR) repeat protein